jgi:phage tail-like protein
MANDPFSAACFYKVKIDTCPVGGWTKVDGLSINIDNEQKEEGGNPFWKRLLVKGIKYGPITVTRPVSSDTGLLIAWFTTVAAKLVPGGMAIELQHPDGSTLHTWTLMNAVPTSYKVTSLGAGQTEIVMESVTFEHQGILEGLGTAVAALAAAGKSIGI